MSLKNGSLITRKGLLMSNIDRTKLRQTANAIWQDSLAKFDPTRIEANGFEIEMFRHGAEYVYCIALDVMDRMLEDLKTGQSYKSTISTAKHALLKRIEESE